jgi:hypothetical protein
VRSLSGYRHGHAANGRVSPEYNSWRSMVQRCSNAKHSHYADYGGRGIQVCRRWRGSFIAFLQDLGPRPSPRHTLERRHNGRGYTPTNCHWATPTEQHRNTRGNHCVRYRGRVMPISAWAEEHAMCRKVLRTRLHLGWAMHDALNTPVAHRLQLANGHACRCCEWTRGGNR